MKEVEKELEWAKWKKGMWAAFFSGTYKEIVCIERLEREAATDGDYETEADSESETIDTDTASDDEDR